MSQFAFWSIQGPGWLLFVYLVVAQCLSAVNYDLGIRMKTQEPADRITDVGVAFFWGFALSDLVFYTPLLGIALAGHFAGAGWADILLAAVFGITVYWPVTCLAAVYRARGVSGWTLPKERDYWIVLPIIALWGVWGLVVLLTGA